MKTKTINLYQIHELSEDAKKKAHQDFKEENDYPTLKADLKEQLGYLLEENGIAVNNNAYDVLYSLSYSQGDGVMFYGSFSWKGLDIKIKHEGRYYHENSKTITMTNEQGEEVSGDDSELFDEIYCKICQELEKIGYSNIEEEDSFENFANACECNDWYFDEGGSMTTL